MSQPARNIVPLPDRATASRRSAARRGLVDRLANGDFTPANAKFVEFMPDVEAISRRRHSPFATALVGFCCLFVMAAVAWMMLFDVEQVVTAPGVARPASKVKNINHQDGGRIVDIAVKDGDRVNAGDVLLRLDADQAKQEIAKLEAAWYAVGTEVVRLQAEAAGTAPVWDGTFAGRPDVVAGQQRLYEARQQELQTHRAQADALIAQQQARIDSLNAKIASSAKSLAVLRNQESKLRSLAREKYFPELQWQTTQRKLIEEEGDLAAARNDLVQAQKELAGSIERRDAVDKEWRAQVLKRLADAIAERDRAAGALRQQTMLLQNLVIRSPIAGIVQGLRFNTVGQAIKPGEAILNVVPIDDNLLIEVRIGNEDIGYVRVDQPCTVKIQTYDWARYGTLKCVVEQISADATYDDKSGTTYFTAWARTDRSQLSRDGVDYPVLPGMTASVDMKIGERSIMSYFLDRLTRTMGAAFKER